MDLRLMATWVDARGRVVGKISQGIERTRLGQPVAVYVAEAVGLPADPCPRFECARKKVEGALLVARIKARATL